MAAETSTAEAPILVSVLTPGSERYSARCDSVRFFIPDGKKNDGGSVGIRRGHADALMAVAPGKVEGFAGGERVLNCVVGGGLAIVGGDKVSILTDRADDA